MVQFGIYWFTDAARLRPDVAIWRTVDRPGDGGAFRLPPVAICEVLSSDADHDLVRKAPIYADAGVSQLYVDPDQRNGWWARLDGTDHADSTATWSLPQWPPLTLEREQLLAD